MATHVRQGITLKGSCEIMCEYLDYAMNNVLFQRGVQPEHDFVKTENYGVPLFMLKNADHTAKWMKDVFHYSKIWLEHGRLKSITLKIVDKKKNLVVEDWKFTMNEDKKSSSGASKSAKDIRLEIRDVMRQITSTISFLPRLKNPCTLIMGFDGITAADFPRHWNVCHYDPVRNPQSVQLKSFARGVHQMSTTVSYSLDLDL